MCDISVNDPIFHTPEIKTKQRYYNISEEQYIKMLKDAKEYFNRNSYYGRSQRALSIYMMFGNAASLETARNMAIKIITECNAQNAKPSPLYYFANGIMGEYHHTRICDSEMQAAKYYNVCITNPFGSPTFTEFSQYGKVLFRLYEKTQDRNMLSMSCEMFKRAYEINSEEWDGIGYYNLYLKQLSGINLADVKY